MPEERHHALLGLDIQELTEVAESSGQPAYRGRQLFHAIYGERLESPEQISTLPQNFRRALQKRGYSIGQPRIEKRFMSSDGTVRYLIGFDDKESVETVWMPEGDDGEAGDGTEAGEEEEKGRERQRATICVSSQVGCAVGCQFCLTAQLGVKRNLTAGEIVGQITAVLNDQKAFPGRERLNLVFMGMGEPLLNFDNFMKAVRLLVEGVGIPESRITVSTAGIVPRIYDLGRERVRPKLAISLNAPNNELRSRLMPLNRKWDLEALLQAARDFPLRNRERLTFEYVLLSGVNDLVSYGNQLLELIRGIRAKVNLIALNPGPGIEFSTPVQETVLAFQQVLVRGGVPTFIRRPRGRDIYAACGQLKRSI